MVSALRLRGFSSLRLWQLIFICNEKHIHHSRRIEAVQASTIDHMFYVSGKAKLESMILVRSDEKPLWLSPKLYEVSTFVLLQVKRFDSNS